MKTQSQSSCSNLIIRPYPADTLVNIAHIMAFFKEFYEVDNPDFYMSDESRMGFYILLAMVQQAAEFEAMRLGEQTNTKVVPFNHEPMPKKARDELEKIFNQMLGTEENDR